MPYSQTFPNGQELTSSALSVEDFTGLLQQATCYALGYMNGQPFQVTLDATSNVVALDDLTGVAVYMKVSSSPAFGASFYGTQFGYGGYGNGGYGVGLVDAIPPKTVVTAIDQNAGTITISNKPTASGPATIFITNPLAGRLVRQEWPSEGQPGFDKTDNVTFLRAVEIDDWYNKVRDQGVEPNDATSAVLVTEYTRVWRVSWNLYGPDSYQRATLLKSALQLDFIHDSLQAFNVYLMPEIGNPRRFRELERGQWWERTDIDIEFYEQVNEGIVAQTVASVEVQVLDDDGLQLDLNIGV
jgi:hypothetical protein